MKLSHKFLARLGFGGRIILRFRTCPLSPIIAYLERNITHRSYVFVRETFETHIPKILCIEANSIRYVKGITIID